MSGQENVNLWASAEHVLAYLAIADTIPHRVEGEAALLACLPGPLRRVADLGSGDGRLLALVLSAHQEAEGVALEFSPPMLDRLRMRFASEPRVTVVAHDLNDRLPPLGKVDAVVSCFAIHHVPHPRKRALYEEVFNALAPGGSFCNLEHVASPTPALHAQFLATLGLEQADEDPSNKLLDMATQLAWMREIGFADVDCHWKWRELALLAGVKPR